MIGIEPVSIPSLLSGYTSSSLSLFMGKGGVFQDDWLRAKTEVMAESSINFNFFCSREFQLHIQSSLLNNNSNDTPMLELPVQSIDRWHLGFLWYLGDENFDLRFTPHKRGKHTDDFIIVLDPPRANNTAATPSLLAGSPTPTPTKTTQVESTTTTVKSSEDRVMTDNFAKLQL